MGGWAAARAAAAAEPGEIDRLVLLAAGSIEHPERMQGRKLFLVAREDPIGGEGQLRLPAVRDQYERAPEPKELVILEGLKHALLLEAPQQVAAHLGTFLDKCEGISPAA